MVSRFILDLMCMCVTQTSFFVIFAFYVFCKRFQLLIFLIFDSYIATGKYQEEICASKFIIFILLENLLLAYLCDMVISMHTLDLSKSFLVLLSFV